jgi:4-amino-4-deoxy-L-arabinose transferase-like glycosyltransferase
LGIALGYAWATYPYALFALQTNSNDGLVAMCTVLALLALTLAPAREGLSAVGRGAAVGLGAAAKFAPLALAPLFAGGLGSVAARRSRRLVMLFGAALLAVLTAAVLPFVGDGGLREVYDRTIGYQVSRPSPFSVWGQSESLGWLQTAVKAGAVGLALVVAVAPRRRGPLQVAALGAAVTIAVQLGVTHWFYLYVSWFAPLALVALLGPYRRPAAAGPPASAERSSEREPVPA